MQILCFMGEILQESNYPFMTVVLKSLKYMSSILLVVVTALITMCEVVHAVTYMQLICIVGPCRTRRLETARAAGNVHIDK
jgi:hypothetical protein